LDTVELPSGTEGIRAMAEDATGDIWLGTSRGHLLRVHNNALTDETPAGTNPPPSIRALCATSDGSLWLGYASGGLGRLREGRFSRITSNQGLYDGHISQIIEDGLGWLWLGSAHGIFKVRLQELAAVAEGRTTRVLPVLCGQGEGLHRLEANFGYVPGVLRGRDGRLWMPTLTGLVLLDPARLGDKLERPAVLLKRVTADGRTLARYGGVLPVRSIPDLAGPSMALRLPPQHRRLEFEFTALSFAAPENVRFQYQIEGLDDGWVDAGSQRSATYSRLAPGQYRFRLRACNSQGVWNESGPGLVFAVEPFFWQTWWFGTSAAAGLTCLVFATVRYVLLRNLRLRLRAAEQQAALEKERTRIARDIHDDIGNLLTKTMLLSRLVQRDCSEPAKTGEHARQIASTVEQVTNSLDEIVWAVNPRNDTLPQLVDYIGQFAVDFVHTAGIRCRVDLPDHPPHRPVSAEVRHGLFLVVKEALNNAVRHAGASEIVLHIAVTGEVLTITVQDAGRGFSPEAESGGGNGLRNMRQRVEEIGGIFQLESRSGEGTRVELGISLVRAAAGQYHRPA
jgi:signal transduction histidine kinase